jgi:nucleotide-binding universal stress UspA family protein
MITKVVVPLDGSDLATNALLPARSLAEVTGASMQLLTTHWDNEVDPAREHLEEHAASLGYRRVETTVVHDRAAPDAIVLAGSEPGAVVCMATHGRSGVGQAVLGSVAEAVVRASRRPVLLIGPSVERGVWQFGHWFVDGNLLVPVDGSEASEAVVAVASEWAGMLHLRPWVTQVLPAPVGVIVQSGDRDAESAYVRAIAKQVHDGRAATQWEVLHATDPADALVAQVQRLPATLVAMATHGRTGIARTALGSVAMCLVHRSSCPVLVVSE